MLHLLVNEELVPPVCSGLCSLSRRLSTSFSSAECCTGAMVSLVSETIALTMLGGDVDFR